MQDEKDILEFIVIGAQKAGTTSLFEYLKRHPELCLPLDKEAPYFSHDEEIARGWDHYIKKTFGSSDPVRKWGTITTHYMVGGVYDTSCTPVEVTDRYDVHTVPLRIREQLPDVRLIAILRDPVERALSHHQMALMSGQERRTFGDAIDDLLRPEWLATSRRHPDESTGYVTWGEYGRILTAYLEVFPRDQLMVAFTDELKHAPEQLLRRVHEFVGVSPNVVPNNLGTKYRQGATRRRFSRLSPSAVQRTVSSNPATRSIWHLLPPSGRRRIDRSFAHLSYKVELWNQRSDTNVTTPSATTLDRLRKHYEQDTAQLASALEIDRSMIPW
jgi:hypothetical protein